MWAWEVRVEVVVVVTVVVVVAAGGAAAAAAVEGNLCWRSASGLGCSVTLWSGLWGAEDSPVPGSGRTPGAS
uniref:Uncharacterized protein n=1 Tax=Anopheles braziliensis TaxID=58242 RepID=A0A2M3ZLX4_9DIPT